MNSELLSAVAAASGITLDALLSRDRHQGIAHRRHIACYLLSELTHLGPSKIGDIMGNRDHSVIINSCNVIKARMAESPAFAAQMRGLLERLRAQSATGVRKAA